MHRQFAQVVLILTDGTAKRISGEDALLFQNLMTEAIQHLSPENVKKFHTLPWQEVKVTSKVAKLKGN